MSSSMSPGRGPATQASLAAEPRPGGLDEGTREEGGAGRDLGAVAGLFAVLGVLGGVLWWLLADPAAYTVTGDGALVMPDAELVRSFDADGWYAVVAALLGVAGGASAAWWRSRDMLLTACLVPAAAAVAAGMMALLGRLLGPTDPASVARTATAGDLLPTVLEVTGTAGYLVWPIAALAGVLLVLWSPPARSAPEDQAPR